MKEQRIAEKLRSEHALSEASFEKIDAAGRDRLFSLSLELRTLLYAGVLLLAGGLGLVIYKNIDTIGHITIILFIAGISCACFYYCYKNRLPYSDTKVVSPNIFFDYVLLLASLTLISFVGYLQYEYSVFGSFNGGAFLLPAIVLFAAAYFFDNIGVLSMAISTFAAFAGITIAPTSLLEGNSLSDAGTIYAGLCIGALLVFSAFYLNRNGIKQHFTFTYYNFAFHLLFVFCLSGLFTRDQLYIFVPVLAVLIYASIVHAKQEHSFYFFLFTCIYGYIGFTYLLFRILDSVGSGDLIFNLGLIYLLGSSIFIIRFLKNYRTKIKQHDSL